MGIMGIADFMDVGSLNRNYLSSVDSRRQLSYEIDHLISMMPMKPMMPAKSTKPMKSATPIEILFSFTKELGTYMKIPLMDNYVYSF